MTDTEKLTIVQLVAECMGPDWHADPSTHPHSPELHGPDGIEFVFRMGSQWGGMRGRIVIAFTCDNELWKSHNSYQDPKLSISVREGRDPHEIAKEIRKRLLPDSMAYLATLKERRAASDAYERRKASNVDAIIEALGGAFDRVIEHSRSISVGRYGEGPYGGIRIDGENSFRLELHCNTDDILSVAELLSELRKATA
jgi:hypothetical protein